MRSTYKLQYQCYIYFLPSLQRPRWIIVEYIVHSDLEDDFPLLNDDVVAGHGSALLLGFLHAALAGLELDSQCYCIEWWHNPKLDMTTVAHCDQHLHMMWCLGLIYLRVFLYHNFDDFVSSECLGVPLQVTHGTA